MPLTLSQKESLKKITSLEEVLHRDTPKLLMLYSGITNAVYDVQKLSNHILSMIQAVNPTEQYSADVNAQDDHGHTPLMLSIKYQMKFDLEPYIVSLFKYNGANLDIRDNNGKTALHHAANKFNYAALVERLLKNKVDVNAQDNDGCTPLHVVSLGHGNLEIATLLLNYKADPNIQTINGNTPLYQIVYNQDAPKFVEQLLEKGAKLIKHKNGETALDVARKKGYLKVVSTIKEKCDNYKIFAMEDMAKGLNVLTNPITKIYDEILILSGVEQEQANSHVLQLRAAMKMVSASLVYMSNPVTTSVLYSALVGFELASEAARLKLAPSMIENSIKSWEAEELVGLMPTFTNFAEYYVLSPSLSLWATGNIFAMACLTDWLKDLIDDNKFPLQNTVGFGLAAVHYVNFVDRSTKLLSEQAAEIVIGTNLFTAFVSVFRKVFNEMIFNNESETSEVNNSEMIGSNVATLEDEL